MSRKEMVRRERETLEEATDTDECAWLALPIIGRNRNANKRRINYPVNANSPLRLVNGPGWYDTQAYF